MSGRFNFDGALHDLVADVAEALCLAAVDAIEAALAAGVITEAQATHIGNDFTSRILSLEAEIEAAARGSAT